MSIAETKPLSGNDQARVASLGAEVVLGEQQITPGLSAKQEFLIHIVGQKAAELTETECDDVVDVVLPAITTLPVQEHAKRQKNHAVDQLLLRIGRVGTAQAIPQIAEKYCTDPAAVEANITWLSQLVKPHLSEDARRRIGNILSFERSTSAAGKEMQDTSDVSGSTRKQKQSGRQRVGQYQDEVGAYLDAAGKYKLLEGLAEEQELSSRIQAARAAKAEILNSGELSGTKLEKLERVIQDGSAAQEKFITSNLKLVVSIAKTYQWSGIPLADLIQEGNLGMIHAIEKYDPKRGNKFSTYATWWIRQHLSRSIETTADMKRLPSDVHTELRRIKTMRNDYAERHRGMEPSNEVLAGLLAITPAELAELQSYARAPLSLDELTQDGKSDGWDRVSDPQSTAAYGRAEDSMISSQFRTVLSEFLDEQEMAVLLARFSSSAKHQSHDEIMERYQLPAHKVRRIEAQALEKISHPAMYDRIRGFAPSHDPENLWKTAAACLPEHIPRLFAARLPGNPKRATIPTDKQRTAACSDCPIKIQCEDYGKNIVKAKAGVWGGVIFSHRHH